MEHNELMRNGWKQRVRITAGVAALAFAATDSFATVMEFDDAGRVTSKPAINYLQRARLARKDTIGNEVTSVQTLIEQKVNNIPVLDDSTAASAEQTSAVVIATLPDISMVPSSAITFVDVAAQIRSKKPWRTEAIAIATSHAIPSKLFLALINAESGFDANAVSPKGAIGLTQLMPATAKSLGVDPYDPKENLSGGARYLRQQYDRFGSWPLALAAYNAGPTRVARLGRIPNIPETKAFVARVMRDAGLASSPITTASN